MGAGMLKRGQASAGILFYSPVLGKERRWSGRWLQAPQSPGCFCCVSTTTLHPPAVLPWLLGLDLCLPQSHLLSLTPPVPLGLSPFSRPSFYMSTPEAIPGSTVVVVTVVVVVSVGEGTEYGCWTLQGCPITTTPLKAVGESLHPPPEPQVWGRGGSWKTLTAQPCHRCR